MSVIELFCVCIGIKVKVQKHNPKKKNAFDFCVWEKMEKSIILLTVRMQNHDFHGCIYPEGCKYRRLHRISQKHDANHLELFDK